MTQEQIRHDFEEWYYHEYGIKQALFGFGSYHSKTIQGRWRAWRGAAELYRNPNTEAMREALELARKHLSYTCSNINHIGYREKDGVRFPYHVLEVWHAGAYNAHEVAKKTLAAQPSEPKYTEAELFDIANKAYYDFYRVFPAIESIKAIITALKEAGVLMVREE